MQSRIYSFNKFLILAGLGATITLGQVMVVQAQQLEEIIVTAQRREQSLQDVPVSVQAFQGEELNRQGFDTLNELTTFAPGLVIKSTSEEQGLILRGAGTQSKNLGIEQGVPTFIDGIHMGRGSQVLNSYMDIQRIEVLKGPQPVFFGQNAAAGALNIETRKPGDTWEGSLSAEYGNFGKAVVEGAVGGPVTDTFGVRVAAKYYRLEGFMTDWWTGEKFPEREYKTFRITTRWQPTDSFQATFKFETAENDLGPRVQPLVLDKYSDLADAKLTHGHRAPITGILATNTPPVNQQVGEFTNLGIKYGPTFINPRVESQLSAAAGLPPLTEASSSNSGVVLDFTQCQKAGGLQVFDTGGIDPVRPSQFESCNMTDESGSKPWHAILDLNYTFANDIELASKTGFSYQEFYNSPYNSGGGAFALNNRARGEFFDQWSEELRLSSAAGGQIEWMAGVYWQKNNLSAWSDAYRANWRNQIRATRTYDDSRWMSGFATVTFNFYDNKASIDIGGRYTDIHKEGGGQNRIGEWFVEDSITGDIVRLPYGSDATCGATRCANAAAYLLANPGIVNASVVGRSRLTEYCDSLLGRNDPNGMGRISSSNCAGVTGVIDDSSFDPQVVLRYRPSDNISLYGKYATSFKSGAFDMAVSNVTQFAEDFTFGPEEYETFEFGIRGSFMNGRLATELTAFTTDITGVQVSFIDRISDRNITRNIAAVSSDGIEFSGKFAASDRLTLSSYLSVLDATVVDFPNAVCTEDEILAGVCIDGVADRSGKEARNAPDWQFTGNLRYELPTLLDGYYSNFDATVTGTDKYTTDRSFSDVVSFPSAWDLNLSYEFGGIDNRWSVLLYARNLMENTQRYYPELDISGEGVLESSAQTSLSNFASYGARVKFNFF